MGLAQNEIFRARAKVCDFWQGSHKVASDHFHKLRHLLKKYTYVQTYSFKQDMLNDMPVVSLNTYG